MTLARAESITGCTVNVTNEAGWITVTGVNPDYGYTVIAEGKSLVTSLGMFVHLNYKQISAIVREEQEYRCLLCGRLVALEIDHINMRSHGRDDRRANLRALGTRFSCGCHARRHGLIK